MTLMPDFEEVIASPIAAYEEGLAFFRGQGMLNKALLRIAADLERHGIAYAVIGAIALNQHGYERFTADIDLLMTKEGLEKFRDELVGLGYRPAFPGATKQFKTSQDNIRVKTLPKAGDRKKPPTRLGEHWGLAIHHPGAFQVRVCIGASRDRSW